MTNLTSSYCAWCITQKATHILTAGTPGKTGYRAALSCPTDLPKARTWVSRAGPPTEKRIAPNQQDDTLFNLPEHQR
jgi:hypothetical protein